MRVFAGFCRKDTSNDIGVARHVHVLRSHAEVYSLCGQQTNKFAGRRFWRW